MGLLKTFGKTLDFKYQPKNREYLKLKADIKLLEEKLNRLNMNYI